MTCFPSLNSLFEPLKKKIGVIHIGWKQCTYQIPWLLYLSYVRVSGWLVCACGENLFAFKQNCHYPSYPFFFSQWQICPPLTEKKSLPLRQLIVLQCRHLQQSHRHSSLARERSRFPHYIIWLIVIFRVLLHPPESSLIVPHESAAPWSLSVFSHPFSLNYNHIFFLINRKIENIMQWMLHVMFFSNEFFYLVENMKLLHLSRTAIYILCRPLVSPFCTLEKKTKENMIAGLIDVIASRSYGITGSTSLV